MAIYEISENTLVPAPVTSFQAAGLRERADIQRLLRDKIEYLEDGLMVLAEEFSGWLDSNRRIDLLCLDGDARLVVVELKRDEEGGHMELQALRYAAMISTMTFEQAVHTLAGFRNLAAPDLAAAQAEILTFLGWGEMDQDSFGQETRIILAAADFSKEITTTAMWLRERAIDIRCIRLKPYRMADGRLLIDIQPLIPLPEAADFQNKLGEKRRAERKERAERHDLRLEFLQGLLERAQGRSLPHVGRTPQDNGVLQGSIGRAGLSINYVTGQAESRVELLIQSTDAEQVFSKLIQLRATIEQEFGGALEWQEKAASLQRRVYCQIAGGYRSPESAWPAIQDAMIDAMLRLNRALRPVVATL